jgi:hypothetical protein
MGAVLWCRVYERAHGAGGRTGAGGAGFVRIPVLRPDGAELSMGACTSLAAHGTEVEAAGARPLDCGATRSPASAKVVT